MDITLLFASRMTRLFSYGFLSIVLALYLSQIGLNEESIGLLFTLTLFGDAGVSLLITTSADKIGRRRMLLLGAALIILAGVVFVLTRNLLLLMIAAIIGVISPSGGEIGPFLPMEQAAISQLIPNERRTQLFAWYNLVGSFATALGALGGGLLAQTLQESGFSPLATYRIILIGYAISGVVLCFIFLGLSPSVEVVAPPLTAHTFGLHRSRGVVMRLCALFALDSFAGGFILQSMLAYWFHIKFGIDVGTIGRIFFGANLLAGISALLAAPIAARIGLVNTMVFTHLPSNVLLCLVPLMPNLSSTVFLLLLRFSISQMDIPTRQSYTMAVVAPDERSAAAGVTTIARSVVGALSPMLCGMLLSNPLWMGAPFFVAGGLKIIYDLLLYSRFKQIIPPEEAPENRGNAAC
ncbi:MAG: MFS transporter [Nitrospirae bacterium]|nr:MFS transporter [Candidatus Troglogloeales bacterium]